MPEGHSNLMRIQTQWTLCSKDESGCGDAKLWRDADIREF